MDVPKPRIEEANAKEYVVIKVLLGNAPNESRKCVVALIEYERIVCQKFCTIFYSKLPQELRDLVYDLLEGRKPRIISVHEASENANQPSGFSPWKYRTSYFNDPQESYREYGCWWKQEYAGEGVVMDLVKRYYRRHYFQFGTADHDCIGKFLETDIFRTGLQPSD
ncbi:hypothetical protein K458DRAFT_490835 [Lentithecium fluviatile CBS 122367]|uniref:Uncharacterized protein n=1 Tax=Lentithecium fluviatile CBS 122367 TaxID=1168545 RepID=A0A6G1ILA0_9PLEO|nr:hypothetical protein K458DRAFT_490835 [Lentithecium fluviatile CBS 122367]